MDIIKPGRQVTPHLRRPAYRGLLWLLLCLGLGIGLVQADGPNRVGLVVARGDKTITRCIEFDETEISGYEVLERSGLDLNADLSSGMGAAICRIDGQGCTYPAEDCFCQCQGTPCIFWIYWHLDDGEWQFSSLGASSYKVRDGGVEGWVWGKGSPEGDGAKPPVIPFEEICVAQPTDTPTPVPPTPTDTPLPTDTPTVTPVPSPVIHSFTASQTTISAGESVILSWDLSDADAAYLRSNGTETGVVAPGSQTVIPATTTTYILIARNEGGETQAELTITVSPATESVPPVAAAAVPTTPAATTPTPAAVAAAAVEPVIAFKAAALTLPAGACTQLSWETQQAAAVYLDAVEVGLRGSQAACPGQTQVYTLRAIGPGGEQSAQLSLQVTQPIAQATAPLASPTPLPAPSATLAAAVPAAPPPPREDARRFTVEPENEPPDARPNWLLYGSALMTVLLLLAAPLALFVLAGAAWWLRGRR